MKNRIIYNVLESKVHLIRDGVSYDADIVRRRDFELNDDGSVAVDDNGNIKFVVDTKIAFDEDGFFTNELRERGVTVNHTLINTDGRFHMIDDIAFNEAFIDDSTFEYHNVL